MAGVDLRTVADFLGHATIQQTMVYAHLAPEHKMEAISRLELFSSRQPSEQPLTVETQAIQSVSAMK